MSSHKPPRSPHPACFCGKPLPYEQCCHPLHRGEAAASAEALMRSRYSAYVLKLADYLLASWHPQTRPQYLDLDETPAPQWLGLEIKACGSNTAGDGTVATVEFVARYRINGRAHRLHETSRFSQVDGHWRYIDGDLH